MKRLPLYTSGVAAFALFVYLLSTESEPEPAVLAEPPTQLETRSFPYPAAAGTAVENAERPVASAAPQGVDFEAIRTRLGAPYDPMLVGGIGEFTDEEIDAYNALHVLPFNRVLGSECRELPHGTEPDDVIKSCRTVREHPEHPYTDLSDEALAHLAVHDAAAAVILGRRTLDEGQRLHWYLRAAALAEKSGPVMALAERRYSAAYKLQNEGGRFAPVPQPDNVTKRLALEIVAHKLNDPRARPQRWREVLMEVAGPEQEKSLERAEALAREYLELMAKAQREVTGSVQIQEIIDA